MCNCIQMCVCKSILTNYHWNHEQTFPVSREHLKIAPAVLTLQTASSPAMKIVQRVMARTSPTPVKNAINLSERNHLELLCLSLHEGRNTDIKKTLFTRLPGVFSHNSTGCHAGKQISIVLSPVNPAYIAGWKPVPAQFDGERRRTDGWIIYSQMYWILLLAHPIQQNISQRSDVIHREVPRYKCTTQKTHGSSDSKLTE